MNLKCKKQIILLLFLIVIYAVAIRLFSVPEEAEPILGVVALENAGIAVDPVSRQLKRMTAKSLK
ncbi:MAG: hypothetical protein ACUZ8O_01765 [Candidatus Anammoxibacter sp.]